MEMTGLVELRILLLEAKQKYEQLLVEFEKISKAKQETADELDKYVRNLKYEIEASSHPYPEKLIDIDNMINRFKFLWDSDMTYAERRELCEKAGVHTENAMAFSKDLFYKHLSSLVVEYLYVEKRNT